MVPAAESAMAAHFFFAADAGCNGWDPAALPRATHPLTQCRCLLRGPTEHQPRICRNCIGQDGQVKEPHGAQPDAEEPPQRCVGSQPHGGIPARLPPRPLAGAVFVLPGRCVLVSCAAAPTHSAASTRTYGAVGHAPLQASSVRRTSGTAATRASTPSSCATRGSRGGARPSARSPPSPSNYFACMGI
jgi:hypothetical protein